MAPSNVLSMAQLRTLPLADQIKILMKNGGWTPPSPRRTPALSPPGENGVWGRLRTEGQGQRLPPPRACLALQPWPCLEGTHSAAPVPVLIHPGRSLLCEHEQTTDPPVPKELGELLGAEMLFHGVYKALHMNMSSVRSFALFCGVHTRLHTVGSGLLSQESEGQNL